MYTRHPHIKNKYEEDQQSVIRQKSAEDEDEIDFHFVLVAAEECWMCWWINRKEEESIK